MTDEHPVHSEDSSPERFSKRSSEEIHADTKGDIPKELVKDDSEGTLELFGYHGDPRVEFAEDLWKTSKFQNTF